MDIQLEREPSFDFAQRHKIQLIFDSWHGGKESIDKEDFETLAQQLGQDYFVQDPITDEYVSNLFERVDCNEDGHIQFEELLNWLCDNPALTDRILSFRAIPLPADAPSRSMHPAAGVDAALGTAFTTKGRPNFDTVREPVVQLELARDRDGSAVGIYAYDLEGNEIAVIGPKDFNVEQLRSIVQKEMRSRADGQAVEPKFVLPSGVVLENGPPGDASLEQEFIELMPASLVTHTHARNIHLERAPSHDFAQRQKIQLIFEHWCGEKGSIDQADFKTLEQRLYGTKGDPNVPVFEQVDRNGDGRVHFEELLDWLYDETALTDRILSFQAIPLPADAPLRSMQPAAGSDAALGSAFTTRGRSNFEI